MSRVPSARPASDGCAPPLWPSWCLPALPTNCPALDSSGPAAATPRAPPPSGSPATTPATPGRRHCRCPHTPFTNPSATPARSAAPAAASDLATTAPPPTAPPTLHPRHRRSSGPPRPRSARAAALLSRGTSGCSPNTVRPSPRPRWPCSPQAHAGGNPGEACSGWSSAARPSFSSRRAKKSCVRSSPRSCEWPRRRM
jgi:hypothetical protein